jgi:hypothetical protein
MKITINDHRKVSAIQEEFSSVFPDLRLEFHARPSRVGAPPAEKLVRDRGKSLLDCRSTHEKGEIDIEPGMSAEEIKENFRDAFGLSVEILPSKSAKKNMA